MSDTQRCEDCRHWNPGVSPTTGKPQTRSQPGDCEYQVAWPEKLPKAYGNVWRSTTPKKWRMWFDDGFGCECYEPKSKQAPQKQGDLSL